MTDRRTDVLRVKSQTYHHSNGDWYGTCQRRFDTLPTASIQRLPSQLPLIIKIHILNFMFKTPIVGGLAAKRQCISRMLNVRQFF